MSGSTDVVLVIRARVAAGCAWDGKSGGPGNETTPQEPEVRRILRECANRLAASTERAQQLIDITFQIGLTMSDPGAGFAEMTIEQRAQWIAKQLRDCGFDTEPVGASRGVLR